MDRSTGAVVVVLEVGAGWPSTIEPHRDGHAGVVVVAQQDGERADQLARRVRARVAELRLSKRCARTAVLVARPQADPRVDTARALLARALSQALCPGCGVLWLVAGAGSPRLRRHLQGLAAALQESSCGPPVDVCLEAPEALDGPYVHDIPGDSAQSTAGRLRGLGCSVADDDGGVARRVAGLLDVASM